MAWAAAAGIALQFFTSRAWPSPLGFIRTDSIMLGVLLGLIMHGGALRELDLGFLDRLRIRVPLVGLLAALLVLVAQPDVAWFYFGLTAAVSAVLVFLAAFNRRYLLHDGWTRRAGAFIGARSYSLYLTHWPAYVCSRELMFRISPARVEDGGWHLSLFVLAVLVLGLFSEFSYRVIERPLRLLGRRVSDEVLPGRQQSRAPAWLAVRDAAVPAMRATADAATELGR